MKKHLFTAVLIFSAIYLFGQEYSVEKIWSSDTIFNVPESVIFDQANNQIIVSNINGSPVEKDNNGFISLLNLDGNLKKLNWVKGMDAPKGMAIFNNKLYVSDIDQLIEIDISTAKITNRYPAPEAQFLNDVCINNMGDVFVSDNRAFIIYKLINKKLEIWTRDGNFKRPNGIFASKDDLLVGNYDFILKINYQTKKRQKFIKDTGSIDGLENVEGNYYIISDWSGAIHLVSPQNKKIKLLDTTPQGINAADIGFIKNEKIILVPTFYNNRIFAYRLIKK